MIGFPKKENFDGLHKCFLEAKFTKFPFLEIFDRLHNDIISFLGYLMAYISKSSLVLVVNFLF